MSPRWRLVVAGNRDELHARPALPLALWEVPGGVIAGRDVVGGGTWLGVSEAGRFAAVTNVREAGGPVPGKESRGRLVAEVLEVGLAAVVAEGLDRFNPFNLIVVDRGEATVVTNRPIPMTRSLARGMHGLSNGLHDDPWEKTLALEAAVAHWVAANEIEIDGLFAALRDEYRHTAFYDDAEEVEPVGSPVFIRNAVYGTRCSTVVTVDSEGCGVIAERRFDPDGAIMGETRLAFSWLP